GDDLKAMGKEDNYLIKADKNPNSRGAADLGLAPRDGVLGGKALLDAAKAGKFAAVVVVEHELGADAAALAAKTKLISFHSHPGATASAAAVALPRAHYAEQDGSFTNVQGRKQAFKAALTPLGDSLGGAALAGQLGAALGATVAA